MSVSNHILTTTYTAAGTIDQYRIVKFGSSDNTVIEAIAATDRLVGVAYIPGVSGTQKVSGDRLEVVLSGVAELKAGGTITRGDLVTSDANGQAVVAAPGAGVNNQAIGKALVSALSGDVFPVLLAPQQIQGAA
ncbi:hypothetical protein Pse7367_3856 (plasmid) [Thalassoporum mexicanum PCC 7367]|uniref:DUF2190 family protein n=1 Tax=Thalassoporum mexicanum TaxID=3457544 RepID=UPI00029FE047|nr:DUF2190 family protein [Pseudanabaena sp. PCC 7367]AFY72079.1 hypothetical protein Pse7367_3856 [Pseudanabaena sp. PCC 7367]